MSRDHPRKFPPRRAPSNEAAPASKFTGFTWWIEKYGVFREVYRTRGLVGAKPWKSPRSTPGSGPDSLEPRSTVPAFTTSRQLVIVRYWRVVALSSEFHHVILYRVDPLVHRLPRGAVKNFRERDSVHVNRLNISKALIVRHCFGSSPVAVCTVCSDADAQPDESSASISPAACGHAARGVNFQDEKTTGNGLLIQISALGNESMRMREKTETTQRTGPP